jgi:hypothetical protein
MKKLVAAGLAAGALFAIGGGQALAEPADQGNCISTRDNGGAAGARNSAAAGPSFGPFVADLLGGGLIGSTASDPGCRRP